MFWVLANLTEIVCINKIYQNCKVLVAGLDYQLSLAPTYDKRSWHCLTNLRAYRHYSQWAAEEPGALSQPGWAPDDQVSMLQNFYFLRHWCSEQIHRGARKQGILKGEVSLYHWPPVWLVWNLLYDNWHFFILFAKQTNPNQSNRRSTVQWYFPL